MIQTWLTRYQAPHPDIWQPQTNPQHDSLAERLACVDLLSALPEVRHKHTYALLGFCCDEGIKRCQGQSGSIDGPDAIRRELRELAFQGPAHTEIFDCGDIVCQDGDLEMAQSNLCDAVALLLNLGCQPVLLGGGQEMAWGHYQGIGKHLEEQSCGVINFGAHLNLDASHNDESSYQTAFHQIADFCHTRALPFDYLSIGSQPSVNTAAQYLAAEKLNTAILSADQCASPDLTSPLYEINRFLSQHNKIYLSLSLNVFSMSVAPGVNTPQVCGLMPWQVKTLMTPLLQSNKLISFDVADCTPQLDQTNQTAKLAAHFIWHFIHAHH